MSIKNTFSQLAGKIVHAAELQDMLERADVVIADDIARLQDPANFANNPEAIALIENINNGTYLPKEIVDDFEGLIRASDYAESAGVQLMIMLHGLDSDMHFEVQPLAQFLAFAASDNQKLVDFFVKTAEECTDRQDKRDTLVPADAAVQDVIKKFEAKFGK